MSRKKKGNVFTFLTKVSIIISILSIIVWVALYNINNMLGDDSGVASNVDEVINEPKKEELSILFAGVDEDKLRTDSIIYAKYDTVNNELYMMSIPRDTYSNNKHAYYKLNSIYYGGKYTKEFIEEVEKLLAVKMDYYIIIDLSMVKQIVDQIGGLTITLDKEVWKLNKDTGTWYSFLPAGEQTLSGEEVETLARNRDYADGDISRGKMQRKIISALIENLSKPKNILKATSILNSAIDNINTNATVRDGMRYVSELKEIDTSKIISVNMPIMQIDYSVDGVSCVLVDKVEARRIIAEDWKHVIPLENEN